jgi:hypothetical protein
MSSGSAINGVSAQLYVAAGYTSTSGTYSDIFLEAPDGTTFIQLGVFTGRALIGSRTGANCSAAPGAYTVNWTAPHLMLGAIGPGQTCETLRDLGEFGSTNNFRTLGLRRNANGTYYATLDNVTKYTTSIAFPEAMSPGIVAETGDTCAYVTARATTATNGRSLAWHDNARGWQYWTMQSWFLTATYPDLWDYFRPSGDSASFQSSGTSSSPDC